MTVKIYVSSDHAGFNLRKTLVKRLRRRRGFVVDDRGPATADALDYPDEAEKVGLLVRDDPGSRGLLICGSGVGMCMAANKMSGVRAVGAWSVESAKLSRAHNDANVLCLGARLISDAEAIAILDAWLAAEFDGGRHAARVAKIDPIAERNDDSRGADHRSQRTEPEAVASAAANSASAGSGGGKPEITKADGARPSGGKTAGGKAGGGKTADT